MKIAGNETAMIVSEVLKFRIGKYRLYRVKLTRHYRWFLLDHPILPAYKDGLKRINDNFFVCIGKYKLK